jgi:hypothetical protein
MKRRSSKRSEPAAPPTASLTRIPEIFATRGRIAGLEALRDLLFEVEGLPLEKQVRLILEVDRQCLAAEIATGRRSRALAEGVYTWQDLQKWLSGQDAKSLPKGAPHEDAVPAHEAATPGGPDASADGHPVDAELVGGTEADQP